MRTVRVAAVVGSVRAVIGVEKLPPLRFHHVESISRYQRRCGACRLAGDGICRSRRRGACRHRMQGKSGNTAGYILSRTRNE